MLLLSHKLHQIPPSNEGRGNSPAKGAETCLEEWKREARWAGEKAATAPLIRRAWQAEKVWLRPGSEPCFQPAVAHSSASECESVWAGGDSAESERSGQKNTKKTHHEDKRAQKREFSPQAVKEKKRIKEKLVAVSAGWAAAQMCMGKALQHMEDVLGTIPFSRGAQSL